MISKDQKKIKYEKTFFGRRTTLTQAVVKINRFFQSRSYQAGTYVKTTLHNVDTTS